MEGIADLGENIRGQEKAGHEARLRIGWIGAWEIPARQSCFRILNFDSGEVIDGQSPALERTADHCWNTS